MEEEAGREGPPRPRMASSTGADPRASPLFADYPDPPPVFLQYSASEILRDDNRRLVQKLRAAGGAVVADEWPDTPHVFTLFAPYVPEAREGLARAARFIDNLWAVRGCRVQAGAMTPATR